MVNKICVFGFNETDQILLQTQLLRTASTSSSERTPNSPNSIVDHVLLGQLQMDNKYYSATADVYFLQIESKEGQLGANAEVLLTEESIAFVQDVQALLLIYDFGKVFCLYLVLLMY